MMAMTLFLFLEDTFICLFLVVLGLCCHMGLSPAVLSEGPSVTGCSCSPHRLLLLRSGARGGSGFSRGSGWLRSCGSLALEHRLHGCGPRVSCSAACGVFPDQGSDPCPLHRQAFLYHWTTGKPSFFISYFVIMNVYFFKAGAGNVEMKLHLCYCCEPSRYLGPGQLTALPGNLF